MMVHVGYWIEMSVFWCLTGVALVLRVMQLGTLWSYVSANMLAKLNMRIKVGQVCLLIMIIAQLILALDIFNFFGIFNNFYLPWILSLLITFSIYAYFYVYIYYTAMDYFFLIGVFEGKRVLNILYCSIISISFILAMLGFVLAASFNDRNYLFLSYVAASFSFLIFGSFYCYAVYSYRGMLTSMKKQLDQVRTRSSNLKLDISFTSSHFNFPTKRLDLSSPTNASKIENSDFSRSIENGLCKVNVSKSPINFAVNPSATSGNNLYPALPKSLENCEKSVHLNMPPSKNEPSLYPVLPVKSPLQAVHQEDKHDIYASVKAESEISTSNSDTSLKSDLSFGGIVNRNESVSNFSGINEVEVVLPVPHHEQAKRSSSLSYNLEKRAIEQKSRQDTLLGILVVVFVVTVIGSSYYTYMAVSHYYLHSNFYQSLVRNSVQYDVTNNVSLLLQFLLGFLIHRHARINEAIKN